MDKPKTRLYAEKTSFWVEGMVILLVLAAAFQVVGCWGLWSDRFFIITQIALPALSFLLFALFVSLLEQGTQYDILKGNLYGYKGAVFENLIADIFHKMGRELYYFHKDSGLEIDFVIKYRGKCTLVEVKAENGNAKSVKTILAHPEKYHVDQVVKLGHYNVGRSNQILTLPSYMAFLLTEK